MFPTLRCLRRSDETAPRAARLSRMTLRICAAALVSASSLFCQTLANLDLHGAQGQATTYKGKTAVHLTQTSSTANALATVKGASLLNGSLEADVAGAPAAGAESAARGFIGIAFRMQGDGAKFELFYIRPTNGRADDQLRRNHSVQYESVPEFPWSRLRDQAPGVYESYTDLEAGAWTHLKIVVSGSKGRLYVNHSAQPCLIVNDLKLPPEKGGVALWIGPGTDGYFTNLNVQPN